MYSKLLLIYLLLVPTVNFAGSSFEGFFEPEALPQFPITSAENSVFKLEIAPKMHGTAFSITNEILVTNAHNITKCLREHGYVNSGYNGSKGPLACTSLSLILADSSKIKGIKLLGSNSRFGNGGWDFAIIKISGLNAKPIKLRDLGIINDEPVYVVGFPGITYRNKATLEKKIEGFTALFIAIFEAEKTIGSILPSRTTSEDIFYTWIEDGFTKFKPHLGGSDFLSGSLLGHSWNPMLAWQNETAEVYFRNLNNHIEMFKKDSFILLNMVEKGIIKSINDYPDADDSLKVSNAIFYRDAEAGVKILKGDATPGSSGSLVIDSNGSAVGILFQIRGLEPDSNELCSLDATITNLESIKFKYCPALGFAIVSIEAIQEKIIDWNIQLL